MLARTQSQSKVRIEELKRKFPILNELEKIYSYQKSGKTPKKEQRWTKRKIGKQRKPILKVFVQRADPSAIHLSSHNANGNGTYIGFANNERAQKFVAAYALDANRQVIKKIAAVENSQRNGRPYAPNGEISVRDVLTDDIIDNVHYVMLDFAYIVHGAPSLKRERRMGELLGLERRIEVEVLIFRKPKDKTFRELVEIADRLKDERENAWKYPPKETPALPGVHQALRNGCRLHAFSSGGGLRVVRLENLGELKGYGEHPHVEEALVHLNEDYLAGSRPYKEVYGKKYPHYLTGDTVSTSNLDYWVRSGSTFDAWQERDKVVFQLKGLKQLDHPKDILERATAGETIQWQSREFTFETTPSRFANGDKGCSTRIIGKPERAKEHRAWMWHIIKIGLGHNFWEAMTNALNAPEIEIIED